MSVAVPAGFRALPLPLAQLSLAAVLKCGQSFRWSIFPLDVPSNSALGTNSPTHEYRLCLRDRVVCLRQSPDTLFYRSVFPPLVSEDEETREAGTLAWIRDYFQLNVDLVDLYRQWSLADPIFKRIQDRFEGIRMLRQDPFENLISFICSSNNNISRITKMVTSLCRTYSPALLSLPPPAGTNLPEEAYHPFPSPSALAAADVTAKLRALGFGYRADFIQKTAAMLVETHGLTRNPETSMEASEEWLMTLRHLGTPEARAELLNFMGVGRKVADCILLMSLDKREVIPVDTHVQQIAIKHYGFRGPTKSGTMSPKVYEELSSKLAAVWGDYAGWAHSVLFTSDLKSFAAYGLASPSGLSTPSTPGLTPDRSVNQPMDSPGGATPRSTPRPQSTKRKRGGPKRSGDKAPSSESETEETLAQLEVAVKVALPDESGQSTLVDRVKRRRRGNVSVR
ncbi:DNA glycosylase [Dichomitus squalens LYAD-421 SS1]|uniref:DNA glycosylase n=1 Tax=Dichomitus squalens (strain LYAD-421) TaxID=732165 RepID=UPI0004413826|nr:DNA glycosylase [Dichomitus squalens LYAD-421 SS1]EJF66066.1 DNA glycosylase [Dichomitus squalens LYAD-421 SS1]